MSVEDIFVELSEHMLKGLMFHEEMANYFAFLCLEGYSYRHEHQYEEESKSYRKITNYYITHYNQLIPKRGRLETPQLIPNTWYGHDRKDVDANIKRNAIREAFQSWVNWEKETKELYESKRTELCEMKEVSAALFIDCFIRDVDNELKDAETELLNLMAINFDMPYIMGEQEELKEKNPCY